ncbi:hypothetical protein IEQ34_006941 [Dendrobium chrysotoxum]|uniref:Uncharacterized protein n=1 Tax=Dendrobium chrysotoxum TaxID=161865 RepID=A0AAV7GRB0_DENCH|nr:hypothetical protein IEQ34_006765 [Dendrobium chrysotoxum]KAH0464155.1 hypothetical protein IEQ34_006941 [Dendrobium chrysotoxum]
MKSISFSGLVEIELRSILANSMDFSELFESTVENFVDVSDCSSLAGNSNKRRRLQKSQID